MRQNVITLLVVVLLIAGAFTYFLLRDSEELFCGDGVCNERACCTDCGCDPGFECVDNSCSAPDVCGDGKCDDGELCCEDCGCPDSMWCNEVSQVCESSRSSQCGNQICDAGEDSMNCCLDCGCVQSGTACDKNLNVCELRGTARICGDGRCDFGENINLCCEDCGTCDIGTRCNADSHKCEVIAVAIDRAQAITTFKLYLIGLGESGRDLESYRWDAYPDTFEGNPVLRVCNVPESGIPAGRTCGKVSTEYKVVEHVRYW